MKTLKLILGFAVCGALLTGCGAIDRVVLKKPTPVVQQVPQVQSTTITNQAGIPITTYATNFVTVTNQVYAPDVNPQVTQVTAEAQKYTGLLPPPYSDAANLLLLVAGGAAAFYAKMRSIQLNQHKIMVQSIVAGIEAVPDATSQAVKDSIATHSAAAGVAEPLDKIVQAVSNQIS